MPAAVLFLDLDDKSLVIRNGEFVHGYGKCPALVCRYLLRIVEGEQDILLELLYRRFLADLGILNIEPHKIRRITDLGTVCQRHAQQQYVRVDKDISNLELHAGILVFEFQIQGEPFTDCFPDPFFLFA